MHINHWMNDFLSVIILAVVVTGQLFQHEYPPHCHIRPRKIEPAAETPFSAPFYDHIQIYLDSKQNYCPSNMSYLDMQVCVSEITIRTVH